jgi:hypothetical protein
MFLVAQCCFDHHTGAFVTNTAGSFSQQPVVADEYDEIFVHLCRGAPYLVSHSAAGDGSLAIDPLDIGSQHTRPTVCALRIGTFGRPTGLLRGVTSND